MRRDPHTNAPNFFSFARDYLHAYMPTVRGLSPKTIQAYRISLECFLGYLDQAEHIDRAQVSFEHFDRPHLKGWLVWMAEQRHYAPKTVALRLSAIKAFLAYCSHEDITLVALSQAAQALRAPATPRTPIEYLTEPETRAVLAAFTGTTAKSRRNRMLLILLYDTAARVSEITGLTLQDLVLATPGHVTLTGKRQQDPHRATDRQDDRAPARLPRRVPPEHGHPASNPARVLQPAPRQPTRLSTDTVAAVLKTAARTARTNCPTVPESIHCHMLRKTKAMDLYQQHRHAVCHSIRSRPLSLT